MLEYKREKNTLETKLEELDKKCTHHDDHIRVIDAWWIQVLQEVALLANGTVPYQDEGEQPFERKVEFHDLEEFETHLEEKGATIKSKLDTLFSQLASNRGQISPNVTNLESQVNNLMAKQKDYAVKLERLTAEKEIMSDNLNKATLRYMKAERKLDRTKSAQVQKLEQQALANSTARSSTGGDQENGTSANDGNTNHASQEVALQELHVVSTKQKEQLDAALAQNKALQTELTTLQLRLAGLTDEDYSRTEVFKLFKAQNEELTNKLNNLEAEHVKLKQEKLQLEKERETCRQKFENEAQSSTADLEDQLQQADTTLARVRAARDELHADVVTLKTSKEQEKTAMDHMKDLVSAKDDRISALESEVEKLKVRLESTAKDRDKWKTKSISNSSEEEEMLRSMATCSICKKDFKNTVIRGCGHIFCRGCVDDRLANRMRKCPNCNKAFDKSDIMTIHL
ncbi:hypothetical protein GGR57DRAFT_138296 [Xylariaceae sp. FL1272]|nr:hypothetical protein GGR57DRAFT_138296 [Xylariaceae sp. FL1272]